MTSDDGTSQVNGNATPSAAWCETALQAGVGAWGVLLNRSVSYTANQTQEQRPAEALSDVGVNTVISTIQVTGTHEGTAYLVMPEIGAKGVVAYMMALMTGEALTPEETELDAEGMDAYSEAVSQFLGTSSQALRDHIQGEATLTAEDTRCVDFEASPPAVELGTDLLIHQAGEITLEGMEPVAVHFLVQPEATGASGGEEDASSDGDSPATGMKAQSDNHAEELQKHVMHMKVPVVVILAEKKVRMEIIQTLSPGSIIEFRKLSGELLDLCVGKVKIAEGEVVITNEHFGIQVRKLIDIRAALMAAAR